MTDDETYGQCPACDSTAIQRSAIRGFAIAACPTCGLRWLLEPPRDAELLALYNTGFYSGPTRVGKTAAVLHKVNNWIRLRSLRTIEPGRLLDVGSGKGRFLAVARAAGWDCLGIEFADSAAAIARTISGVPVVTGDFLTAEIEGPFDVITMWHTLEHLPDPRAALARSAELLETGGRVVVSVPNSASVQARVGGDAWFHLDLPRHLYHYTPSALTALLENSGFEVEGTGYLYPEMEAIGLIQTALNRAGLGQDVLDRFAKNDDTAGHGIALAASLFLAAALTPAALVWSLLAPALRTGASIQVVARLR